MAPANLEGQRATEVTPVVEPRQRVGHRRALGLLQLGAFDDGRVGQELLDVRQIVDRGHPQAGVASQSLA